MKDVKIVDFIIKMKQGKRIRNIHINNKSIEKFDLNINFEKGTWEIKGEGKLLGEPILL